MTVVNSALYVDGARVADAPTPRQAVRKAKGKARFAWVGLLRPDPEELASVGAQFGIHELALAAVSRGHLRSRIDQYGDDMAIVVRAARYLEATETVEFGLLHVFLNADAIVTVRLAEEPDLARAREELESRPDLLAKGPRAALLAVLNAVADTYDPVVEGLENDIDEIEDQIFSDDHNATVSRRIYELHREVIGFQRAVLPLTDILAELRESLEDPDAPTADVELARLFRDLHHRLMRVGERIENFRSLLDNALAAHSSIVSQRQTEVSLAQTEQTKKISAWAAILYLPSMIGAIYGMNFKHFPELDWVLGYPFALGLMVVTSAALYAVFKKADWL